VKLGLFKVVDLDWTSWKIAQPHYRVWLYELFRQKIELEVCEIYE
jgi:hypothetical protein